MLSRKRAKGKETSWFQLIVYGEQNKSIQCKHGLDELSASFTRKVTVYLTEVWVDDNNRTMAMSILLNLGTNHILRGEYITASSFARAVAVLEKHEMGGSFESAFYHGATTVIKINGEQRL